MSGLLLTNQPTRQEGKPQLITNAETRAVVFHYASQRQWWVGRSEIDVA
jgi:hypothetical protein